MDIRFPTIGACIALGVVIIAIILILIGHISAIALAWLLVALGVSQLLK